MTALAEAITALINSSPRSPRPEEIENVIKQHVPSLSDETVHRIDPASVATSLPPLISSAPRLRLSKKATEDLVGLSPSAIVLYAAPLLLVDPRDDNRTITGLMMKPRCIYAAYYDEEMDEIGLSRITPWPAIRVMLPQTFDRLLTALRGTA